MPGDLLLSMDIRAFRNSFSVIAFSQEIRSAVVSVGIEVLKSVSCAAGLVWSVV